MSKYVSLSLLIVAWLFSGIVNATSWLDNNGSDPICIFHLSNDAADTFTTQSCTISEGSTSAFGNFYGPVPDLERGVYRVINHYTIEGNLPCIVIKSDGIVYTTDNYQNVVQSNKYGGPQGGANAVLSLYCVGLTPFEPE